VRLRNNAPFFVTSISLGSKLDNRMQWDFDVGQVGLREVVVIAVSGSTVSYFKIMKRDIPTDNGE
jgi:hypothetical protein